MGLVKKKKKSTSTTGEWHREFSVMTVKKNARVETV